MTRFGKFCGKQIEYIHAWLKMICAVWKKNSSLLAEKCYRNPVRRRREDILTALSMLPKADECISLHEAGTFSAQKTFAW